MVKKLYKEATIDELENAGKDFFNRDLILEKNTKKAFEKMQCMAKLKDINLYIVSGFRSYAYQQAIINKKLAKGLSLEEISKVNALVGESEHHTGKALDLTDGNEKEVLTENFETTEAFKWLKQNAYKFGFKMSFPRNNKYGFIYEPWHWCYEEI